MALYADGQGKYGDDYDRLWQQLVPPKGQCTSLRGEIVRVIGRLASEYYRNGNMNWESGYDKMRNWLADALLGSNAFDADIVRQIKSDLETIKFNAETGRCPYTNGEDEYDRLTDRVVEFCMSMSDEHDLGVGRLPYQH